MIPVMANPYGVLLDDASLRWAAAESVSEAVIAAICLLETRSVDEIVPKLTPTEPEQVIKIVGRCPRSYPPGAYDALKAWRTPSPTPKPSERVNPTGALGKLSPPSNRRRRRRRPRRFAGFGAKAPPSASQRATANRYEITLGPTWTEWATEQGVSETIAAALYLVSGNSNAREVVAILADMQAERDDLRTRVYCRPREGQRVGLYGRSECQYAPAILRGIMSCVLSRAVTIFMLTTVTAWHGGAAADSIATAHAPDADLRREVASATPIKHLVVIFNENVSFDHYFATYPNAANLPSEPMFHAKPGTPTVNNLATANLLADNPNFTNKLNGSGAAEPFRLNRSQARTADQTHEYTAEQLAYDGGKTDLFPRYTGSATPGNSGVAATSGEVMGYYDGNTVAALWNYAQYFAMNDNGYTDTFGSSTPGALNVSSGQTNGMIIVAKTAKPSTFELASYYISDGQGGLTVIGDVDPAYDVCSDTSNQAQMAGRNIGDLLNAAGVTWGSFMGGFRLDTTNANGSSGCNRSTYSAVIGADVPDYIPHHAWFQYHASTANPRHLRPNSLATIGYSMTADGKTRDPANHNYDLQDFYTALKVGNFPAVSYIKMPAYQDGHAGYSDPLDEQVGTVTLINFLEQQPDWESTAVIVTWDDSDGWYDHAFAEVTSPSFDAGADQLDGPGRCGNGTPLLGVAGRPVNGRCGPGTRIPFLVISPWAKANYVGHERISLASVVRFIEDNWLHGERLGGGSFDAGAGSINDLFDFAGGPRNGPTYLDPATGLQVPAPAPSVPAKQ